ncbi:MAG: ribosomal protein small subunit ribosomal protein [Parcubacteria group bacterium]|nr:ribosomal protein small subunit ribosomal protein [Parcubacteria group bacterium]
MLMIRFQRIGRKNDPAFRMLVLEKASGPKAGKYVDLVGTYNPKTKAVTLQPERIKDWVAKGAQVSPSLMNLLISKGVFEGKKKNVLPMKTYPVPAPVVEEAPAAPAPVAEAPVETAAEEAPVEVTPEEVATVEEAPVEEAAVEEAPAEEAAPAEEVAA